MRFALRRASIGVVAILTTGCVSSPPPKNFGLGDPGVSMNQLRVLPRQLLVAEPAAVQPLDGDGMIVFVEGRYEAIAGGRWSDRLTRLLQERLVGGFEVRGIAVGRTGSGLSADFVLGSDVKRFELIAGEGFSARIELSMRLVDTQSGRIVAARAFRSDSPAASAEASEASAAFGRALDAVLPQITAWAIAAAR
jgi:cholesterol transport system auxiliary component